MSQYQQDVTAEQILFAISKNRAVCDLGTNMADYVRDNSNRSREQLNNKTIKELNNSSREVRGDEIEAKSPLSQTPLSQVAVVSKPAQRELTYRGINIQHCKPKEGVIKQGIKLAITLQSLAMLEAGGKLLVTAELKRYDRLREIKPRLDDSSEFNQFLEDTKRSVYEIKDKSLCMGRIHARGKRSSWVHDALVIGFINNDVIVKAIVYIEGEEYEIDLTTEVSELQKPLYYATGTYGVIENSLSKAPRMSELKLTPIGA